MKISVKINLVSGIFLMMFSILVWFLIPFNIIVKTDGLNAQFFPKAVITTIFFLSCTQVFQSLVLKKDKIIELEIKNEMKVLIYGLSLLVYIFLIEKIGFLVSSILISIVTLWTLKPDKKYQYIIQICLAILVYIIFTQLLNIKLP